MRVRTNKFVTTWAVRCGVRTNKFVTTWAVRCGVRTNKICYYVEGESESERINLISCLLCYSCCNPPGIQSPHIAGANIREPNRTQPDPDRITTFAGKLLHYYSNH